VPPSGEAPIPASQSPKTGPGGLIVACFLALRPKQWLKNVLVFIAPAAAGTLFHGSIFAKTLVAFASFCLAASGLYLLNDLHDVESDRAHPKKRFRPIASGRVPEPLAVALAIVLLGGALALGGFAASWHLAVVLAIYEAITLSYTYWLKEIPVIELVCVASGFLLRALGGGAATNTPLSVWFVVVISFGALFLVTGKRLAELPKADGTGGEKRPVLAEYTRSFLESAATLTVTISVAAYCLWTFDKTGLLARAHGRQIWIQLTVVPIVIAALHVLRLLDRGEGGAPDELAYHDRILQVAGIAWVVLVLIGVYG
jgi:decaprenyl-phosphate phosphoribosyltransferase